VDRYALVVLRKGTSGKVDIALHGHSPEGAFALAADAVERVEGGAVRRAGVDISISAPGEFGQTVTSAVAVALVGAISAYADLGLTPGEIATEAAALHTRSLGWSHGWEHCCATGGISMVRREGVETTAEGLRLIPGLADTLNRHLMLFAMDGQGATTAEGEWDTPRCVKALHDLRAVAEEMRMALEEGALDLFGKLLDLSWTHEQSLPIPSPTRRMEAGYRAGLDAGAAGGRVVSPSMLLLYGSRVAQEQVQHTMGALGWEPLRFRFDWGGVQSSGDGQPGRWSWEAGTEVADADPQLLETQRSRNTV
jgi:galactokinase/mevalonate kinase-like predicted kinase